MQRFLGKMKEIFRKVGQKVKQAAQAVAQKVKSAITKLKNRPKKHSDANVKVKNLQPEEVTNANSMPGAEANFSNDYGDSLPGGQAVNPAAEMVRPPSMSGFGAQSAEPEPVVTEARSPSEPTSAQTGRSGFRYANNLETALGKSALAGAGEHSSQNYHDMPSEYRQQVVAAAAEYTPQSLEDFLGVIKRTPRSVLSGRERNLLAAVMSFSDARVEEIMLPKEAITYVHDDEILGPLTLTRLYKTGFAHFPVVDHTNEVVGIIHTAVLNSLEEKTTHRAGEFMDRKACFVREDYTLQQALAAFFRTNSYFFIVVDRQGKTVGLLTYQMIINFLFGKKINDDFSHDSDRMAVAKREFETKPPKSTSQTGQSSR